MTIEIPNEIVSAARRVVDGRENGSSHFDSYDVAVADLKRWAAVTLCGDEYLLAQFVVLAAENRLASDK